MFIRPVKTGAFQQRRNYQIDASHSDVERR